MGEKSGNLEAKRPEDRWKRRNRILAMVLLPALILAGAAGMIWTRAGWLSERVFFPVSGAVLLYDGHDALDEGRMWFVYVWNRKEDGVYGAEAQALQEVRFPEIEGYGRPLYRTEWEVGPYVCVWNEVKIFADGDRFGGETVLTEAEAHFSDGTAQTVVLDSVKIQKEEAGEEPLFDGISSASSSEGRSWSRRNFLHGCRLAEASLLGGEKFSVQIDGADWQDAPGRSWEAGDTLLVETSVAAQDSFSVNTGVLILDFEKGDGTRQKYFDTVGIDDLINSFSCEPAELRAYLKERGAI